jgi:hypothetical protein
MTPHRILILAFACLVGCAPSVPTEQLSPGADSVSICTCSFRVKDQEPPLGFDEAFGTSVYEALKPVMLEAYKVNSARIADVGYTSLSRKVEVVIQRRCDALTSAETTFVKTVGDIAAEQARKLRTEVESEQCL